LRYGNGTETDYQYNAVTRQAKRMELYTSENNSTGGQIKILDKSYQYNALGMISSIANSAGHLGTSLAYNDLGGSYSFNYTYDDHGRLSSVGNSSWTGSGGTWTYNLSMTYAKDGRILSKDQGFVGPGGTPHATMDYALSYQYGASADVHQLTKIVEDGFDINVTYNARGGIKHIDNKKTKELTTHVWDQDMRLRGTKNNGGLHHNVYDWTGTRLMKSTLTSATVYQNGNPTTTNSVMPYIVYAGSHYVFEMYRHDVEVSKHYFAGDERIATRLQVEPRVNYSYGSEPTEYTSYFGSFDPDGDGTFNPNPAPATPNNIVLEDLCRMALPLGYALECLTLMAQLLPPYIYGVGDRDACWGEDEFNAFVFPMDMTAYCECLDPNQPNRSYDCTLYPFIYWYHHDHKGSTEFVTDLAGMAYEYSLYSPFGEALVSQSANNSGYSNPYKFKGAIYDPETGLTYNVARFYNAKWSIWISPDPLAHLRNWVTPYNYTLNNPINRIDPTGLLCKEVKTGPGDQRGIFKRVGVDLYYGGQLDPAPVKPRGHSTTARQAGLRKLWSGTKAGVSGFSNGIGDGATGTWQFFSHDMWKAQTWKGMGQLSMMLLSYNSNSGSSLYLHAQQFDQQFGSNTSEMLLSIKEDISGILQDISSGDPERVGHATGRLTWMIVEASAGSKGASMVKEAWSTGAKVTKVGISNARSLGIAGEKAVGVGSKVRIESITGTAKYRIPDILTPTTIGEVKNVANLSMTRQLTDFYLYSKNTSRQFILYTRPNTTFSGTLQNLINNGDIIVKPIPNR
jgi:RHS repeat-associated protein